MKTMDFFLKKVDLEICRKDDEARWEELETESRVGESHFGTNVVRLILAAEAKEKFP